MTAIDRGYHELVADDIEPGTRYWYCLDGQADRPDPASRLQPEGVHQASAIVDPQFHWTDTGWSGIPLHAFITYELHVGTFTPEGTFDAVIPYLDELQELGVTAIELMPVAQFPGERNWGYDGVYPFAVQNSYGGPNGLKRLVDAAHTRQLAVVLDVVYNHLGPEGNYLDTLGSYFTDQHHTPWGRALNFGNRGCDEVRRFFIENALYWIDEFHIDALRLDAVHAIYDFTPRPFLQELAEAVRLEGERLNRRVYTFAENGLNDSRIVKPKELGGMGIDAQWCDDLHHALHTVLTGERTGYYQDFRGFEDLVKAHREGYVQDGRYSTRRCRRHGNSARHVEPSRFVVCSQNHDQVGNRLHGERLAALVSFEKLKLAAAVVLLSPYQPLLFMGEEYGETAPFQYFISHIDPELVEAVRCGRKAEFIDFGWSESAPDPQSVATFQRSKLNQALKQQGRHRILRDFYKALIGFRKTEPALAYPHRDRMEVLVLDPGQVMATHFWAQDSGLLAIFNFGQATRVISVCPPEGVWNLGLDSADARWQGSGSRWPSELNSAQEQLIKVAPDSVALYRT